MMSPKKPRSSFPKIVTSVGGRPRIVDQPPVLFHPAEEDFEERVREGLEDYQTVKDHAALVEAVKTGRVEALVEEDL